MSEAKPLALKFKSKSEQWVVKHLKKTDTFDEMRVHLGMLTNIPWQSIEVLSGFPPQAIRPDVGSWTLEKCGVRSGDTLIVQQTLSKPKDGAAESVGSKASASASKVVPKSSTTTRGLLMRKVVPSDNSCLFTSFSYCLNQKYDSETTKELRKLMAAVIMSDTEKFSQAVLQIKNSEYCKWIQDPDSWGGAIELSILTNQYEVEICVVDTQAGNVKSFGEDKRHPHRIFMIYDGIHYDPLFLEPFTDTNKRITVFKWDDWEMMELAAELAKEAQSAEDYTDTQTFSLKCENCGSRFRGAAEANAHAQKFGHINFSQVR